MSARKKKDAVESSELSSTYLFERYIEKYGTDRAQGFIDACRAFTVQINDILYEEIGPKYKMPRGAQAMKTQLSKFQQEKLIQLKQIDTLTTHAAGNSPS